MENIHIMGCWPSRIINQRRGLFPAAFDSFTLLWVNVRKRLERAEACHHNDEEKQIDVADSALPVSFFFFFFTCRSGLSRTTSEELERRHSRCDDSTSWPHQLQHTSIRAQSAHSFGNRGVHAELTLLNHSLVKVMKTSNTPPAHACTWTPAVGGDFPSHMCER